MLTHYLRHHDSLLGSAYWDRIICLFNTNILYTYISRSIPSLYGRLDFFQSTAFQSHTIRELLGCSKGGLSSLSHSTTRAFVFCLAYPTRRGPSYFVSHPLVVLTTWHFLSHQSCARLDLVLVHHRTEVLTRLHSTKNSDSNARRTITPAVALQWASQHRPMLEILLEFMGQLTSVRSFLL